MPGKDISSLRQAFPSWEEDALKDVVEACGGDLEAARSALSSWSHNGEGTSGAKGGNASLQRSGTFTKAATPSAATVKMPPSPFVFCSCCVPPVMSEQETQESIATGKMLVKPRPDYDATMTKRLNRSISASALMGAMLHCKQVFHQRAQHAHQLVEERKKMRRCNSRVAHVGTGGGAPEGQLSREEEIVAGKQLLAQRLAFLNMVSIEMEDDGNCQFRALSSELCGRQDSHKEVRQMAVEHMRAASEDFSIYFDSTEEWERYMTSMATDRTWGDELTLRAICDALCVQIHLVTTTRENWYLHYKPCSEGKPARQLFLTYVSPIHYNTMQPKR